MDVVYAPRIRLPMLALPLVLAVLAACSDPAGSDVPADHTRVIDGVPHAPRADSAEVTCTECHGADLRGGDAGEPSCYRCHGRFWIELTIFRP